MDFDLEQELIKRNISVREILEDYSNGLMFSVICRKHKINPEQLRFILRYNENEEIKNKRNSILESPETKKERFKEIVALVEGDTQSCRKTINSDKRCIIHGKGYVNVSEILEKYRSGRSIDKIMIMYRLSEEQLNKIISENATQAIKNERKENRERFAAYGNMKTVTELEDRYKTDLTKEQARQKVIRQSAIVEGKIENDDISL